MMLQTMLFVVLLAGLVAYLGSRHHHIKRMYFVGVVTWSKWLPVMAAGIYLAILAVNLMSGLKISDPSLSLKPVFNVTESGILFLLGPLLLTRFGFLTGYGVLGYCLQKQVMMGMNTPACLAFYMICASSAVIGILGDRMPWLAQSGSALSARIRDILLILLTVFSLAVSFTALVKIYSFAKWFNNIIDLSIPSAVNMVALVVIFMGWLSVGLGFTRHFTILMLSVPTLFVLAYFNIWNSSILIVPFALCLGLSLATADRRFQNRRLAPRVGTATTVIYPQ